jgi:hypothetical protein
VGEYTKELLSPAEISPHYGRNNAFTFQQPRFAEVPEDFPGPGQYETVVQGIQKPPPYGRGPNMSNAERKLTQPDKPENPGPGTYTEKKLIKEPNQTSAFKSGHSRFSSSKTQVPGVGRYNYDALSIESVVRERRGDGGGSSSLEIVEFAVAGLLLPFAAFCYVLLCCAVLCCIVFIPRDTVGWAREDAKFCGT